MEGAEILVLFSLFALFSWMVWWANSVVDTRPAPRHGEQLVIYLSPLGNALGLALLLPLLTPASWPAWYTRIACGWSVGTLCLNLASLALPFWGLSARQDVAERHNRPAAWAIAGVQTAITLGFAIAASSGAPAASIVGLLGIGLLSTLMLFALWGILEWCIGVSEAITIDRDCGAVLRFVALLVGLALLVGRACASLVAGYAGEKGCLTAAAPVALLAASLPVEWFCVRTPNALSRRPRSRDIVLAAVYLIGSIVLLCVTK